MRTASRGEVNGDMFDRFSLLHAFSGFAMAALGMSLPATFAAALAWEAAEEPLKEHFPQHFPNATQDRPANVVGDVLSVGAGWFLAKILR